MKKYNIVLIMLLGLVFSNCTDQLEVENTNDPDGVRALADPSSIEAAASGLMKTWFVTAQNYSGIGGALLTMSDNGTCSWGNSGMRDLSSEPRVAFNNTPSYGSQNITNDYFNGMYSVIGSANDITTAIIINELDMSANNEDAVLAMAYMMQGVAFGSIALNFDVGYAITESTPDEERGSPVKYTYSEMAGFAIERLDMAIAILESKDFNIPDGWINGMTYTSKELAELANTFAARILSSVPRNKAENAAVNWGQVLAYANKGVKKDFAPIGNDAWYDDIKWMLAYSGWGRQDMRVVNMMDPAQPDYWPAGGYADMPNGGVMQSADARAETDFSFLPSQSFRVERGEYHFSTYRSSRYDDYLSSWDTEMEQLTVAENELYKAEAKMHTGDVAGAAAILNDASNARKARGGLGDVAANADAVWSAIHYERNIELNLTEPGLQFYEMRKNDLLQAGTPLHFPLPAKLLEVLAEDFYTFGGTTGTPGVDYSTGGWR